MTSNKMKNKIFSAKNLLITILVILGILFLGGYLHLDFGVPENVELPEHQHVIGEGGKTAEGKQTEKKVIWTCSMHPQIRLEKPGLCPICGMELIPLVQDETEEEGAAPTLKLSEASKRLAQIQTTRVSRRFVTADVRLAGKIDYQEPLVKNITAWVPGRIDELFVDYTGISVNKGDHLVSLYSPDLLTAQEELLQALKAMRSGQGVVGKAARSTVEATRDKLRLWGPTPEQIKAIEKRGQTTDHLTIYSPISGIVIKKNATVGSYVKTGTVIYTVADLSKVWIKLDAYESDLPWLHYAQKVEFSMEAYPGEVFRGRIAFIDPVLNPRTRTITLRLNVDNRKGKLKPGMFVRATVKVKIAEDGKIIDTFLADKWISPMHPEIITDEPGDCPRCGMPLVEAESLGYVSDDDDFIDAPLVVPASAVLITGKRAVVYVEVPDTDKPTYEGREIVLGVRAGDFYLVKSGLKSGELVVTQGNFKIDSALQIQAKPSMMSE